MKLKIPKIDLRTGWFSICVIGIIEIWISYISLTYINATFALSTILTMLLIWTMIIVMISE